MKRIVLIAMMVFTVVTFAQKKKNGTIYVEHPAIKTVESMMQAFVEGDADKVANYLDDEFKSFNGSNTNKDAKGGTKENFLKQVKFWNENIDYFSIERSKGAYPDALQYKDGNNDNVTWVQTWEHVKGVHKKTGVKLDMPFHRLFVVNKDNKITTMINYYDERVYDEIGKSFVERKNGTIYNHHEYINIVRRMIHAFENDDMEIAYSFYDDKVRFRNINMPLGETQSLEESKASDEKFKEKFDITSIDVRGYPDYLNYGLGNAKVVMSWWNVRLIRKSDNKKIIVPIMFTHNFNDEGKITRETADFNAKLLEE
ncbi:MAG: nuclear transport factor 2 family protein [Lutibacter sp.]|nr:nuclear transport factor 2 family protein [Lutibacter sp.]